MGVEEFPEVVSVTPAPGASNVPTGIYLELGFSQPMDTGSVLTSRLRITDVDGKDIGAAQAAGLVNLDGSSANGATYSFDIEIGAAEEDGLIDLIWKSDHTILKLTSTHHQLEPDNTYMLELLDNQARSATGIAGDPLPLILGPEPGNTTPSFIVQVSPLVQFEVLSSRFTSGGAPFNLRSGFQFTTATDGDELEYPEVLWVTPTPDATKVPTDIYLELGFSQPMDQQSVKASTLRMTDLDNDSNSFEIEIGLAEKAGLINLDWHSDNTILTMTTSH